MKYMRIICFLLVSMNLAAEETDPDIALLKAAEKCEYYNIVSALSKGAYINTRDNEGRTPLILAAGNYSSDISYNKKYNIINLLLSKGADVALKDNVNKTAADYYSMDPSFDTNSKISNLLKYYPASVRSRKLIEKNMDPSYICFFPTYITDIKNPLTSEIYEVELNVPFDLMGTHPSGNFNYFSNLVARMNLRMLYESSSPIKTPSFMPRIYFFFWWNDLNRFMAKYLDFSYFSFMISHHSNGQSANFYTKDGKINTDSGNFSTNFAELSINTIAMDSFWLSLAYQQHILFFNREEELRGQYETGKLIFKARKFFFSDSLQLFGSISYTTTGRDYIQTPEAADSIHPAIAGKRARARDNFQYQAQLHWRIPCFWKICIKEDVSFFIKYDYGYDYYNIHFQEKINKIQFGISGLINR